jgi:hypothetical protein
VRGADPGFYEAIRSQAIQDHPQFEILFGIRDPADPAANEIQRLIQDFPTIPIRLILCSQDAPNGKVGVLMDLAREARHPLLIVSDSDITVPPGYLQNVTSPLADPSIGLVTCLYRAEADNLPSRFEALAIATDFAPSTLVAPFVGVSEFGLGSTLAFRRADLDRIGGFAAIADYLADDYQLGRKLHRIGPAQPDFEGSGEYAVIGGIVARGMAASVAMGAHHSAVPWRRLCGAPGDVRNFMGSGRSRRRGVVVSCGVARYPIRHGHHVRLVRSSESGCLEILLSDSLARSVGCRDLDRRPVRRHRGMARTSIAIGCRGKDHSRGRTMRINANARTIS